MHSYSHAFIEDFDDEDYANIPGIEDIAEDFFDKKDEDSDEEEVVMEEYDVAVKRNVMVEMRDGVKLSGDLYLPNRQTPEGSTLAGDLHVAFPSDDLVTTAEEVADEAFPCLLIRTPYNKEVQFDNLVSLHNVTAQGQYWTANGYACFIQDCRGRFESEGTFYKYTCEAEDGYDTVEWIAQQDWCNGSVGTLGVSYLAHVQTSMAVLSPPHLKAMFCVKGGFFDAFTSGVRQGGALEFRQWVWAWKKSREGVEAKANHVVKKAIETLPLADWLTRYPFVPGYSPISAAPSYEKFIFDMCRNGPTNPYWKKIGLSTRAHIEEFADVPMVHFGGWYDIYARSTVEFFQHLHPAKKGPVKLVMGPWNHHGEARVVGEVDFGSQALLAAIAPDMWSLKRKFFDSYLKGLVSDDDPPVRYFRMGGGSNARTDGGHMFHGGCWKTAESFPPEGTEDITFFFGRHGALTRKPPALPAGRKEDPSKGEFDVKAWLDHLGLEEDYSAVFVQNRVDRSALLALSEAPQLLKELVPMLGDRAKIMNAVRVLASSPKNRFACTSFLFDPRNPCPSIGGNLFKYQDILLPGPYNQWERADMFLCKPPYMPLSMRPDVLCFTSKPLKQSLDVTGVIEVVLYVSSSAEDTDFTAKVVDFIPPSDAYPHGFALNVTHGIQRARYRGVREALLVPNKIYKLKISCYPTSNLFKKGHSIRIDISSSNFPHFDVNPNTGEMMGTGKTVLTARNTVYHDEKYQSHVILPSLPILDRRSSVSDRRSSVNKRRTSVNAKRT